jgi:hypothetical protein
MKVEGFKTTYPKRPEMAMLTADKTDFKTKSVIRDKGHFIMVRVIIFEKYNYSKHIHT